MKQLLILSGKGGTGKTTVAGALIELSGGRAFADCDVDAPNLHLLMPSLTEPELTDYCGLQKAEIDADKCIRCGLCEKSCAFGAIHNFAVGEYECEGCALCTELCPAGAITMTDYISGELALYQTGEKTFSTAKLNMGSGASGKLVTAVKQQLQKHVSGSELVIIDGSPGIGCPVIASVSGVDFVLIVAEPSVSGIHDMRRVMETVKRFGVSCAVCINKYDVNAEAAAEIEQYCEEESVPVIGKIPYDEAVVNAVNSCRSIAAYPDSPAGRAAAVLWEKLKAFCRENGWNKQENNI